MTKNTFIPDSYKLAYSLDLEKKTFAQFMLQEAEKQLLPDLIRLELNRGHNSITGVRFLLRIRDTTNWSKCTLTGLRPTETADFYYADLPINGVKSLCIIKYTSELGLIDIRVCKGFYPHNANDRTKLVNYLIKNF